MREVHSYTIPANPPARVAAANDYLRRAFGPGLQFDIPLRTPAGVVTHYACDAGGLSFGQRRRFYPVLEAGRRVGDPPQTNGQMQRLGAKIHGKPIRQLTPSEW